MSKRFDVYQHPENQYEVRVKRGFSWPAFLFGPFWYVAKGMALWCVFWLTVAIVGAAIFFPIGLLVWLLAGILGNDNYEKYLLRQGYKRVGVAKGIAGTAEADQDSDSRKCPHCAELIRAEAKVCRYCGRSVEPIQVPKDHRKIPDWWKDA